jgi:Bacteriophage head to tail connecting protein
LAEPIALYETSGAAQLAKQPSRAKPRSATASLPWMVCQGHLNARISSLTLWRNSWHQHWSLLETYLLPRRGIFINATQPTPNSMNRGSAVNQAILDPTGTQAMRKCAAGMQGGLMSSSRPWFKLKPAMAERESLGEAVEAWFEEVEDRMYEVMSKSNFYDSIAQMFEDLVTFGTAPVIIYEDTKDIIRCYNPCPGEYFAASSSAFRVETLYRLFVLTVSQIVEMFGLENCPRDVQGLWNTKGASLEVEKIVAHAIEPNFPIAGVADSDVAIVPGDFPWRELYWIWGGGNDRPLSKRGFKDPPFICPRWAVTSNDAYGRSPAMDALPDIMQLQVETARKAEALEKMVRPPMLASSEMKNEPSSILPGHVTYVSQLGPDKGMRPSYTVNPQIEHMMKDLLEIQTRIKTGFYNDLFLMFTEQEGDRRTAYENMQKALEKLQVLGPVVERTQNEAGSPAIKRIFNIMARKRLLPPAPEALRGVALDITYVSMMALAQRAAATAGMERYAQVTGNLSAIYPEAKFKLNPLGFLEEYADTLGVSKRIMNSNDTAKKMMDDLNKQMQQQQLAADAMAAVQGAETLSKTDLGGGQNALSAMIGGGV